LFYFYKIVRASWFERPPRSSLKSRPVVCIPVRVTSNECFSALVVLPRISHLFVSLAAACGQDKFRVRYLLSASCRYGWYSSSAPTFGVGSTVSARSRASHTLRFLRSGSFVRPRIGAGVPDGSWLERPSKVRTTSGSH